MNVGYLVSTLIFFALFAFLEDRRTSTHAYDIGGVNRIHAGQDPQDLAASGEVT